MGWQRSGLNQQNGNKGDIAVKASAPLPADLPVGKTASWVQRGEKEGWVGPRALGDSAGEPRGGDPPRHRGFLSPAASTASGYHG